MTIHERIKLLRDEHDISQRAFADKIGISGPAVAKIESGDRNPSEQTIRMICSVYNVNREWLEKGYEPMYREPTLDDYAVLTRMLEGASENKKKLMRILAEMPDELLDKMLEYLESKQR